MLGLDINLILGVVGKGQSNLHFSYMLKTPETRGISIDLKKTLKIYDFQGVDINWPFPGFRCNGTGNETECSQNIVDKYCWCCVVFKTPDRESKGLQGTRVKTLKLLLKLLRDIT